MQFCLCLVDLVRAILQTLIFLPISAAQQLCVYSYSKVIACLLTIKQLTNIKEVVCSFNDLAAYFWAMSSLTSPVDAYVPACESYAV